MKQLSKLWLDLLFCFILICLTGHSSNYFPQDNALSQTDLIPKFVKLSENQQK
ncbi:MAG: hypothetical protein QNJ34_19495 [Xenococcaceae cyanobacterium MO_188.B29]|nr:hypothetical protein [Xenococcaceae cyanobacterium MO_188.B29]